ncbi:MAG: type II toxin-antitoxin system HicB family antitoxin [Muribaculum sp.]|nr:type II toxin-antitoxin system HicB family antitoxin [Muribaculum sp.]
MKQRDLIKKLEDAGFSFERHGGMKQVYPTFIVNTNDGSEHSFLVCVPDMEIYTEGDTFADAIEMARDAIGLAGISMEDNNEELPVPSDQAAAIEKVKKDTEVIDFSMGVLTYVDVDFSEYRKKVDTKTVRRNVALPSWLNYEAEHAGINVSRVLQEALMNVLNVKRNA